EDHIGALPYLLREVNPPLYATRLTRGLIEVKLKEQRIKGTHITTIRPHETINLPPFRIQPYRVCHSIPDGVGLAVHTPLGTVVHSGDYKFDQTPVDGKTTDFAKLAELGGKGVLLLMADSTNAERPGFTPSEQEVGETFERVFAQTKGRIIVTTFASNISRVQQVIDAATAHRRQVAVVGRSMQNNVKMAKELGYLKVHDRTLLKPEAIPHTPPERLAIVCTGSQGEPASVLVRMANRDHPQLTLVPGDTVIMSATPIPGNEEVVHRTLNNLFRLGVQVYYHELNRVHVSGHASREELKLLLGMLKPRYFMPLHGEPRHLTLHGELAQEAGMDPAQIFVLEDGQVLEIDQKGARIGERVSAGQVMVDGLGVGDVGQEVLRDRHLLSHDGFVIAVVTIDGKNGKLLSGPDLVTRGFVYLPKSEELLAEAKERVREALDKGGGRAAANKKIHEVLSKYLYEKTKRRPMILPVITEV
ncbi:MAG: ribonuclease J, partial [Chloroflexi bacterium]|nr:ribonuclease J [Chloroflexota bacterium]